LGAELEGDICRYTVRQALYKMT